MDPEQIESDAREEEYERRVWRTNQLKLSRINSASEEPPVLIGEDEEDEE